MQIRLLILLLLAACHCLAAPSFTFAAGKAGSAAKKGDNWLAVMDLTATYGMDANLAKALTQVVMTEVSRQGRYDVMSPADIEAVAKREGITQKLSDCDNGMCLIEFGRKLGARYMIAGDVSKIGATYVTTLKFLDTGGDNPGVRANENEKCKCSDDDLIATVEKLAAKLMAQAGGAGAPAVVPASAPSPVVASASASPPPTLSSAPRPVSTISGRGFTDTVTGMEFVPVPAGCFQMGDTFGDGDSDEKPVHEVCLDAFSMGKFEVTQGQWKKVMGSNPSRFKGSQNPVEQVSWNDAQEFIRKLNQQTGKTYRLPTEAEWEYACRSGGKNEKYCGGDNLDSLARYNKNNGSTTHSVGQKQANGLGLYDMSGNVWEWCSDRLGLYAPGSQRNPTGASSGSYRVLRGGSWFDAPAVARGANRYWYKPSDRDENLGFRLVSPPGQ
jgi:formylglycine-generating enzyme required for sulfatase activity